MKESTKLVTACVIAVLFTLAILSSACFFYTGYYQRSLSYSLTQLSYSIERNDVASFDFYVDVPAVSQDIVNAAIARTQDGPDNPFEQALLPLVKATASRSLEDGINALVAGNAVKMNQEDPTLSSLAPSQLGIEAKENSLSKLVKKGTLTATDLHTTQTAMTATLSFTLVNKDTHKSIPVKATMRQMPNGKWRVVHLNNANEIIKALD